MTTYTVDPNIGYGLDRMTKAIQQWEMDLCMRVRELKHTEPLRETDLRTEALDWWALPYGRLNGVVPELLDAWSMARHKSVEEMDIERAMINICEAMDKEDIWN
jgi:hypothetical protein